MAGSDATSGGNAGLVGSSIFGDLFAASPMRDVFCDAARLQRWLDVEAALARVEARLGLIPAKAADEIGRRCHAEAIDLGRLRTDTARAGTPILPLVRQIAARCADGAGEFVHWGATTQDIIDTGMMLQVRDALGLVTSDLAAIRQGLRGLAARHRDTPMAGRSYMQQAAPITFGFKVAVVLDGIARLDERLAELRQRALVGQFGGAVGTLAALGADGFAVRDALMAELGLGVPLIAWHAMRDRVAELGCFLGLLAGTLAKFAADVALMMQTELGEVYEGYAEGRGASSTMPQKRNPVAATFVLAAAANIRQLVPVLLGAMVADHERATGPWQSEWVALPEIFLLSSGVLAHARTLVEGLEVDAARMATNLGLSGGLIASEAIMMALAPALGRQRAHDLVGDLARRAAAGEGRFVDLLAATPDVAVRFDRAALARLVEPAAHVGLAGSIVDRLLASIPE